MKPPAVCGEHTCHWFGVVRSDSGWPVWVAYELGVGLGWVILFGIMIGFPTVIIGGIIAPKRIAARLFIAPPEEDPTAVHDESKLPSFSLIIGLIGIPILLIVLGTIAKEILASGVAEGLAKADYDKAIAAAMKDAGLGIKTLLFLGHSIIALLVATLGALFFLGYVRKVDKSVLMEVTLQTWTIISTIVSVVGYLLAQLVWMFV